MNTFLIHRKNLDQLSHQKNSEAILDVVKIMKRLCITGRLIFKDGTITNWAKSFFFPVESYIESSASGPYLLDDLDSIEIYPIEEKRVGRLIPPKFLNHSEELAKELDLAGIIYKIVNPTGSQD